MFCKMKPGSRFGIKLFRNHNLIFFPESWWKLDEFLGYKVGAPSLHFFSTFFTLLRKKLWHFWTYILSQISYQPCVIWLCKWHIFRHRIIGCSTIALSKEVIQLWNIFRVLDKKNRKKGLLVIFLILVRLLNSLTFGISQESTEIKSLKYDITDVQ